MANGNESHDSNLPSLLGTFTGSLGSSSSSSSFLAMSLESERDSSDMDNEDNEYIDELTRQMADYMLQEDDNDNNNNHTSLPPEGLVPQIRISEVDNPNKNQHGRVAKSSKQRRRGKKTEFQRPLISDRPLPSSGSGCSTALVPTRVLEALEQHFNNLESLSPSDNLHRIQPTNLGRRNVMRHKFQPRPTDHVENKLPKEWSY